MTTLDRLVAAEQAGQLLPAAAENLNAFLAAGLPDWAAASIDELLAKEAWDELNDRFYRFLEFGTGGMRGRTVGVVAAGGRDRPAEFSGNPGARGDRQQPAERFHAAAGRDRPFSLHPSLPGSPRRSGEAAPGCRLRHPAFFAVIFAPGSWRRPPPGPRLGGGEAFIFNEPRPTPQLSFSVRWLKAHAGIVITASHNPPHDNGFKAYFGDGDQVGSAARFPESCGRSLPCP